MDWPGAFLLYSACHKQKIENHHFIITTFSIGTLKFSTIFMVTRLHEYNTCLKI